MGDRNYNRMKYYSSLKTNARLSTSNLNDPTTGGPGGQGEQERQDLQRWLDIPEHMLKINEEAFVPNYGGKLHPISFDQFSFS